MSVRLPRKMGIRPERISRLRMNQLTPLFTEIVSSETGVRLSPRELRLTPDRMKVVLLSKAEMERVRARGTPLYATLLVSTSPIPLPGPGRVSALPEPIPGPSRAKFASIVGAIIGDSGIKLSSREISFIGQNGKVVLPSRQELERIRSGSAPVYGVLVVSINPDPIF